MHPVPCCLISDDYNVGLFVVGGIVWRAVVVVKLNAAENACIVIARAGASEHSRTARGVVNAQLHFKILYKSAPVSDVGAYKMILIICVVLAESLIIGSIVGHALEGDSRYLREDTWRLYPSFCSYFLSLVHIH